MHTIIRIEGVLPKEKDGKTYYKTLAIDEQGGEWWGWSKRPDAFKVGDNIMTFFHKEEPKMVKEKV